jgi:hypothetical protein
MHLWWRCLGSHGLGTVPFLALLCLGHPSSRRPGKPALIARIKVNELSLKRKSSEMQAEVEKLCVLESWWTPPISDLHWVIKPLVQTVKALHPRAATRQRAMNPKGLLNVLHTSSTWQTSKASGTHGEGYLWWAEVWPRCESAWKMRCWWLQHTTPACPWNMYWVLCSAILTLFFSKECKVK